MTSGCNAISQTVEELYAKDACAAFPIRADLAQQTGQLGQVPSKRHTAHCASRVDLWWPDPAKLAQNRLSWHGSDTGGTYVTILQALAADDTATHRGRVVVSCITLFAERAILTAKHTTLLMHTTIITHPSVTNQLAGRITQVGWLLCTGPHCKRTLSLSLDSQHACS